MQIARHLLVKGEADRIGYLANLSGITTKQTPSITPLTSDNLLRMSVRVRSFLELHLDFRTQSKLKLLESGFLFGDVVRRLLFASLCGCDTFPGQRCVVYFLRPYITFTEARDQITGQDSDRLLRRIFCVNVSDNERFGGLP